MQKESGKKNLDPLNSFNGVGRQDGRYHVTYTMKAEVERLSMGEVIRRKWYVHKTKSQIKLGPAP